MKKTVTKIIMAVMAATMLVCAATGCGGKKDEASSSAPQSSAAVSTEASVATTGTNNGSATLANGELSKDMIEYAYYSCDEQGVNAGFIKLDDHSEFGFGGFAAVGSEGAEFYADGKITNYTSKKNADGSTTASFTLVSENPIDGTQTCPVEITDYADGKAVVIAGGKSYSMTKTADKKEIEEGMNEVAARINSGYGVACQEQTDAATVDCACKDYFASIVVGTIDEEYANYVKADKLPANSASEEERRAAAGKCTIKGALEYMGIADVDFDFSKFAADEYGTISAKGGAYTKEINENTTFAEIYEAMPSTDAESDAATIDCACKSYYAEVVSGITEAKEGTVKEALEYMGLGDISFDFSVFGADEDGNIVVNDGTAKEISADTVLAEIYK